MFLPHAHRISLLSPAPVSHIFHSCRPSMPRKQKAALVPTPIKQSHEAMVVSYRPQTLHDTIHTVLPGEVLPAIPSYLEFIAVRLFVFQLTASRRGWRPVLLHSSCRVSYFNSQPYEEADLPPVPREHSLDISTHSLTKRLTIAVSVFPQPISFQLTASRRGWRFRYRQCQSVRYFNSQPHEEADARKIERTDAYCISTHSLTKRLTFFHIVRNTMWKYFNSQPHEEADGKQGTVCFCQSISTHSLTKRLT